MARRKQTRGKCAYCGREMTRGGLSRHLATCPGRQEAIQAANREKRISQTLYHLLARDAWYGDFWLHLEMNGSATLEDLDYYLRAIWLECCGHLSRFSVGGWRGDEIPMHRRIKNIFSPGVELTHIYDFGTSSHTLIRFVGMREGKPLTQHPIALMARNNAREGTCVECGEQAGWWCPECLYERDEWTTLCERHAEEHSCDDYGGLMPLVNSPRVGMCGYDGPAEPPY